MANVHSLTHTINDHSNYSCDQYISLHEYNYITICKLTLCMEDVYTSIVSKTVKLSFTLQSVCHLWNTLVN